MRRGVLISRFATFASLYGGCRAARPPEHRQEPVAREDPGDRRGAQGADRGVRAGPPRAAPHRPRHRAPAGGAAETGANKTPRLRERDRRGAQGADRGVRAGPPRAAPHRPRHRIGAGVGGTVACSHAPTRIRIRPVRKHTNSLHDGHQGCWEAFCGTGRGSLPLPVSERLNSLNRAFNRPFFSSQSRIYCRSQRSFTAVPGRQHNCFPSALPGTRRVLRTSPPKLSRGLSRSAWRPPSPSRRARRTPSPRWTLALRIRWTPTAPHSSLIRTGHTVRSFPTHGQQSAAKGGSNHGLTLRHPINSTF